MKPCNLSYEYKTEETDVAYYPFDPEEAAKVEPILAEITHLYLRWELEKEETDYSEPMQWAYRTAVYRNGVCIWESGKTETGETECKISPAPEQETEDFLFATVTLWDEFQMITDTVSIDLSRKEDA